LHARIEGALNDGGDRGFELLALKKRVVCVELTIARRRRSAAPEPREEVTQGRAASRRVWPWALL
jgi:hypothetical protein